MTQSFSETRDALGSAYQDALTGLPNGAALRVLLDGMNGREAAVAVFDIDQFGAINLAVGFNGGDEVLRETAWRLAAVLPPGGTLVRLGHDRFAAVVPGVHDRRAMTAIGRAAAAAVDGPIDGLDSSVCPSVTVGMAFMPTDGPTGRQALEAAEIALRWAKLTDKGSVVAFAPEMRERLGRKLGIARRLRLAIPQREFSLLYQPKVSLADGRVTGLEALVRWTSVADPSPPSEFIPVAEETGMITQLTEMVLHMAARQMREWDGAVPRVAVNFPPAFLARRDAPDRIAAILEAQGTTASSLCIEVTESAFGTDRALVARNLALLRDQGATVALDDFGTGYSSLAMLGHLPIDEVKIDRTFVLPIGIDRQGERLLDAVFGIAEALRLRTVAEGVETPEQVAFLAARGCDDIQGFVFARPTAPGEIILDRSWGDQIAAWTAAAAPPPED